MFEFLYEWVENIAFYMILATVLIQILPDNTYKKYIRFFTGMILILLLMTPVFRIFGMEGTVSDLFTTGKYQDELEEIERSTSYLRDIELEDYAEEAAEDGIEVEGIRIEAED